MPITAVAPSRSGRPAATSAPKAINRITSVIGSERTSAFWKSSSNASPISLSAEASPNWPSWTSGCAFCNAATVASGPSTRSLAASSSPGSSKFTSTERPSSETLPANSGSSGLSMFSTPLVWSRRAITSLTTAVNSGSPALSPSLPWTSTVSPVWSGNPAASTIWSPRLDSPLPVSSSASVLVPTMPPSTVARITKANQPRIAFLRCCALHLPARAAKVCDCIGGAPAGSGGGGLGESQARSRLPMCASRHTGVGTAPPTQRGRAVARPLCIGLRAC